MRAKYRKLKIIYRKDKPYLSRVVDEQTGETILANSSIDVHITPKGSTATITLECPIIEIEEDSDARGQD